MNSEQPIVKEIHLIDYIYIMMKWRTFILRVVAAVFILSTIAYFGFISRWYLAEASITPAKQKSSFNPSSMLKNALPLSGLGGVFRSSEELDLYLTILNSRNSLVRVIDKFDLMKVYGTKNYERTIKELRANIEFAINDEENALLINVFDTDAERSAAMANYFIDVLNEVYISMSVTEAKNNLSFIERRYDENLKQLEWAEDSLSAFQKKYGIFHPTEQIKSAIQAAATIQSQVMVKEVELGVLRKSLGTDNQTVRNVEYEIDQLQKSLREMQSGTDHTDEYFKIFPLFGKFPQIGKEYLRLMREVELQTALQEVLLPLVEQARIEEQKNIPVVVVLDHAVTPERPKKPRRSLMILLFTMVSFILAVVIAFIADAAGKFGGSIETQSDARWNYVRTRLPWKTFLRFKGSMKDE